MLSNRIDRAGRVLGVKHTTAWKWLDSLCTLGVLEKVRSGSLKNHRVNEYRFELATPSRLSWPSWKPQDVA